LVMAEFLDFSCVDQDRSCLHLAAGAGQADTDSLRFLV